MVLQKASGNVAFLSPDSLRGGDTTVSDIFVYVPSQSHALLSTPPDFWGPTAKKCFLPVPFQTIRNLLVLGVDGNDLPTSSTNQQDTV